MTQDGQGARTALPPLPKPLLQLLRRSPITVFVVGGTAQQREEAARRLHQESIVHGGPFVAMDCEQEAEMLNRALVAWLRGKPGEPADDPVTRASGGTLYLDSIEGLPQETQRMLLGLVLQRMERGSYPGRPRWAARLIVGNQRELSVALSEGRFHTALYEAVDQYRVNLG